MKTLIGLLLLISPNAFAEMKSVGGSMHGNQMLVNYNVLNSGRHVLTVTRQVRTESGKTHEKNIQSIDLNIKNDETLAPYNGFKCRTRNNEFVYGVIADNATKKTFFHPVRAWIVDEANLKLISVQKVDTINCEWAPDGDGGKTE